MTDLALVTGGTRGIGAAISIALKKAGHIVVANYFRNKKAAGIFSKQQDISCMQWNVGSYQECQTAIHSITEKFGKTPEILVNNAGITCDAMLHKMPEEYWHTLIETNLTSCFNMTKAVIPLMRQNNYGRIINISSINGLTGQLGQTNYAAAKAGMLGFTKSLALESARKNITVNAVAPGYIATEMTEKIPQKILDNIVKNIPVGHLGKPDDVARAVAFLADRQTNFITGETLSVNGGQLMH